MKVSIITSAHNASVHLKKTINSILSSSFSDFEYIIIDDASIDNSLNIMRSYNDPRIKILTNENNLGLTRSLNKGILEASGEYIARIDAGDISSPERLLAQSNFLDNNLDIFLVGSGSVYIDDEDNTIGVFNPITSSNKLETTLARSCCIIHSSIMFRNSGINYREKFKYAQDYDLYLRILSEKKKLANLPEHLLMYRLSADSLSFRQKAKQSLFAEKAKEFYQEREKTGKDKYSEFDPNTILLLDTENSTNKNILEYRIEASFKINDFDRVRTIYKRYFNCHKRINKYFLYFMFSFFPKKVVDSLRKILW